MNAPPAEVLEAFGVVAVPEPMSGGRGGTWRAWDLVLKPVDNEPEQAWMCDLYDTWADDVVTVPRPLRADGHWSTEGWGAHLRVPGDTARAGNVRHTAPVGGDGYAARKGWMLALIEECS